MELAKKDVKVELFVKVKEEGEDKETKAVIDVVLENAYMYGIPICGEIKKIDMNGDIKVKDAIYLEAIFRFLADYFVDKLNKLEG